MARWPGSNVVKSQPAPSRLQTESPLDIGNITESLRWCRDCDHRKSTTGYSSLRRWVTASTRSSSPASGSSSLLGSNRITTASKFERARLAAAKDFPRARLNPVAVCRLGKSRKTGKLTADSRAAKSVNCGVSFHDGVEPWRRPTARDGQFFCFWGSKADILLLQRRVEAAGTPRWRRRHHSQRVAPRKPHPAPWLGNASKPAHHLRRDFING